MTKRLSMQSSERLRWHTVWVVLGALIMGWTLWMALIPNSDITLPFPYGDKLLHAITFACLMGWWGNIYRERRPRIWAALACLAFGIFIECAQWFDPPRDASVSDVLVDGIGILTALLLLRTPLAKVLTSVEALSVRRDRH